MPRYIDADALKEPMESVCMGIMAGTDPYNAPLKIIDDAPTADVVERKRGKWKIHSILDYAQRPTGRYVGLCPFCEFLTGEFRTLIEGNRELTNFCPNCGADMNGRIEE